MITLTCSRVMHGAIRTGSTYRRVTALQGAGNAAGSSQADTYEDDSMRNVEAVLISQLGDLSKWTWYGGYSYHDPDSIDEIPRCVCGKQIANIYLIVRDDSSGNVVASVGEECLRRFKRGGRAREYRWTASFVRSINGR